MTEIVTAGALRFPVGVRHPQRETCPGCGEVLTRVGLSRIVYAFAVCEVTHDEDIDYDHIYEQMWHRSCFIAAGVEVGWS